MSELSLVGVPNFSEGRNDRVIGAIRATLGAHARILDLHSDAHHNRSVYTIAAPESKLSEAMAAGAAHALDLIDLRGYQGLHPHIGALDVCPAVWAYEELRESCRGAAQAAAEGIAALGIPVFLYGEMASSPERRERAFFRRGGPAELARRMGSGELEPDLGPREPHPSAGATLVTARPAMVAFNVELDTPNPEIARAVAEALREGGGGLPGVRALGLPRDEVCCQVSINIQDPKAVTLAVVVREITRLAAEHGARPLEAELVGLAPKAALEGYPGEPPIRGYDPEAHILENVLDRSNLADR